jgi:hypothetical protein
MGDGERKFELKDVVDSLSSLTDVMKRMALQIGELEQRVQPSSKFISSSDQGGAAALQESPTEWRDGAEFSPSRPSNASSLSLAMNQDAGTKLERPKFVVKLSKTSDGIKKEFIRYSDYLDYFDDFEHYMSTWENLPMNLERRLKYPNKEKNCIGIFAHQICAISVYQIENCVQYKFQRI